MYDVGCIWLYFLTLEIHSTLSNVKTEYMHFNTLTLPSLIHFQTFLLDVVR